MFYVNTRGTVNKIKQKQLLDTLIIPPEQRTSKDHQNIFHFFCSHQMLVELERVKSLNARIKCIAAFTLISAQELLDDQIVIHRFEDNRMVVLPKAVKEQAESFNEKIVRKKMDELAQFSMIKPLKYEQLLYLAFNMELAECKYKEYLYRQGEQPDFVFLIAQGEFHYVRECRDGGQRSVVPYRNGRNKKRTLKSEEGEDESPNKQAKTHVSRYKVGIVSGNQGQSVGLQQIVLSELKQRKYSVLCNSTENRVIKIHRRYLEAIFQQLPVFLHSLQTQVTEANQAKEDFFRRIKATKDSLKDAAAREEARDRSNERGQLELVREKSVKQIKVEQINRYQLPTIDNKSVSFEYRSRAFSSALTNSLQAEDKRMRSMKSQTSMHFDVPEEQQEETVPGASFALTGVAEQYPMKAKLATKLLQSQTKQSLIDSRNTELPLLPVIGGKRSSLAYSALEGEYINSQVSSVLSKSRIKSKLNQYGGLIDSSQLVRDMQSIMDRKITRHTRKELYPAGQIEYKSKRNGEIADPMKLKASAAHSNRFMEKLLLKVLKKAGYDEDLGVQPVKPQNRTVNVKHAVHLDLHRSMSRNHRKERKEPVQASLLMDSPFDDCYFSKI